MVQVKHLSGQGGLSLLQQQAQASQSGSANPHLPSQLQAHQPHQISGPLMKQVTDQHQRPYLRNIQVVHHFITHLNYARTSNNSAGRPCRRYSDAKRESCISDSALSRLRPYRSQIQEHITHLAQTGHGYQANIEVLNIDQPGFLSDELQTRETPGDLHVQRQSGVVIEFPRYEKAVLEFCRKIPQPIADTLKASLANMAKQLIPGGNPAILSDMQRLMLLLMDTFSSSEQGVKVSFYTDHDSHQAFFNQAPFSAAPLRQILKQGNFDIAPARKAGNDFNTRLAWQKKLHLVHTERFENFLQQLQSKTEFDIRDYLILSYPVDRFQEDKSRDINVILMIHPDVNTSGGQAGMRQLRLYIVSKLEQINQAFREVDNDDTLFRLPAGQVKNEDGFSINEYTALDLTCDVLLDKQLDKYKAGQNSLSEKLFDSFIGSYYGLFLPQQNVYAQNKTINEYEGSWRVSSTGDYKSFSMDTLDIHSRLLNIQSL